MRLRRRVKVFVSYSHQDRARMDELVKWLRRHGCAPQFDADHRGIAAGEELPAEIMRRIDGCEAFLAMGTASLMGSPWCKEEAQYARAVKKHYVPVLCEDLSPAAIPEWFTGTGAVAVRYAECFGADYAELTRVVSALDEQAPAKLSLAVLLLFCFLIGAPILGSWTIRRWIGRADRDIRDLQGWVEGLNQELARGRRYEVVCRDNWIVYQDHDTGEVVARDSLLDGGRIVRRLFYRAGREVATDSILVEQTHGDTPSLSKRRKIYPDGKETGVLIEETFDSIGNLVSKLVRRPGRLGSTAYVDLGVSLYPPMPFCPYR